jgi:hypothetical protein
LIAQGFGKIETPVVNGASCTQEQHLRLCEFRVVPIKPAKSLVSSFRRAWVSDKATIPFCETSSATRQIAAKVFHGCVPA